MIYTNYEHCKPTKGTRLSAGVDLRARETVKIGNGETVKIPLGVFWDFDYMQKIELGFDFKVQHYGALHLRSSLGKKFIIPNGAGVIDFDFKEEFMLLLHNPFKSGHNEHVIEKGDRVAQLIIKRHETSLIGIESDFDRNGGFGSTGK
jgi:deoxyuridine 5'-triphosphate nucleotidohydrolase